MRMREGEILFLHVVNAGTRWMQQGTSTFDVMSLMYYR